MSNWSRQRLNPVDQLKMLGLPCDHITYDPKLRRGEYDIIRGSTHDGTLIFTRELISKALINLADRSSYYKPKGWKEGMRYRVGPVRIATVFGTVNLPCGRFPGERQRVTIPVITEQP